MNAGKRISIVLLLLGRYEVQINYFDKKLKELEQLESFAEIIIVGDSPYWDTVPAFQMFRLHHPNIKIAMCSEHSIPAKVCNLAMNLLETDYVIFSLLQDPLCQRFNQFSQTLHKHSEQVPNKHSEISDHKLHGYYICPCLDRFAHEQYLPTPSNLFGWAMSSEIGFSFGSFCVPVSWIREAGGFDENPLLIDEIERWFALLVTSEYELTLVATEDHYVRRLKEYPLYEKRPLRDMAVRYATYSRGIAANPRSNTECAQQFAKDLNEDEYLLYSGLTGIKIARKNPTKPYKILVVGGFWEYHHEQICFFNYLERMYGYGFATYRSVYEYHVAPNQALDYDLVIFVRCRSDNALDMMRLCEQHNIATLYMIDDNWMSIAKDHPDQGKIFVPGNPNYDNFIEALGLCKATWLFSDVIREDILPFTKCVKKFKISVDPRLFQVPQPRKRADNDLYIGFSGSLRYSDTAFCALARYARRHKNVTVILIGQLSEQQEMLFKNTKTVRIPFSSYKSYAENITKISPDLLIAPLEDTRTMHSKCYNKYIESGIISSACLYSKCKPYTDIVQDGVNGYFVEDDTQDGWYRALEYILSDVKKLRSVQATAAQDVKEHYTTDKLLQEFIQKIEEIVHEVNLKDD